MISVRILFSSFTFPKWRWKAITYQSFSVEEI
jgi:hypothetical protein